MWDRELFGKPYERPQQVVDDDDIRALACELGSNRIWEFPSQEDPTEMGALILHLAPESRIELDFRREPTQHTTRRRDARSVDGRREDPYPMAALRQEPP